MHNLAALFALLLASTTACSTDTDCSLNGRCVDGECACDAAWITGTNLSFGCSVLNVQNPVRDAGLHSVDGGHNSSSWGGSVLRDESTGIYHMFASQMINHCGINAWTRNSHVVHATCSDAGGKYVRVNDSRGGEIFPVFSHEPNAVRDPTTGEWALFFTLKSPSGRTVCNCTDGSTPPATCGGLQGEGPTYVSWASSPGGPWATPLLLKDMGGSQSDTNLAPIILPNGSLVGIWRTWDRGSWPHLVTAAHWKNASSYTFFEGQCAASLRGLGRAASG
jgi:hypothetical protein